tara:strand:+ start:224 stop:427 length:204 start_codon:yes stop_codon:yes gene_type:complete
VQIGDHVKLREIPQNNQKFLEEYKSKTGKVVDKQILVSHKIFLRVLFGDKGFYEDLAEWRLEKFFSK